MKSEDELEKETRAKAWIMSILLGGFLGLLLGFGESPSEAFLGTIKDAAKGLAIGSLLGGVFGLLLLS